MYSTIHLHAGIEPTCDMRRASWQALRACVHPHGALISLAAQPIVNSVRSAVYAHNASGYTSPAHRRDWMRPYAALRAFSPARAQHIERLKSSAIDLQAPCLWHSCTAFARGHEYAGREPCSPPAQYALSGGSDRDHSRMYRMSSCSFRNSW